MSPLLWIPDLDADKFALDPYRSKGDSQHFGALHRLILMSIYAIYVDDATMGQIGSSLPDLRELYIENMPVAFTPHDPDATMGPNLPLDVLPFPGTVVDFCSRPARFQSLTPSDPENRAYKLEHLRFYYIGIGDEDTPKGFANWLAAFCPNVRHWEVDHLMLRRCGPINEKETNRFVESVFEARQTQLPQLISLLIPVHPGAPSTLGNGS
ncbi:hypothetical protein FRB93_008358 [Tulasnella sp. JGI-2019a]|nr:hypothetical protein FRB93_008358 [Tulasnella sp. JGI-2019a]